MPRLASSWAEPNLATFGKVGLVCETRTKVAGIQRDAQKIKVPGTYRPYAVDVITL